MQIHNTSKLSIPSGYKVRVQPIVPTTFIYISDVNGVYRIDPDSYNTIWYNDDVVSSRRMDIDDSNNVYAADTNDAGYVYKIDSNGNTVWTSALTGFGSTANANLHYNGSKLFMGSATPGPGNYIIVIGPDDGIEGTIVTTGITHPMRITADDEFVYVSDNFGSSRNVGKYSISNGNQEWLWNAGSVTATSLAKVHNHLYAGYESGNRPNNLVKLNDANGSLVWQRSLSGAIVRCIVPVNDNDPDSDLIIAGQSALYRYDSNGSMVWTNSDNAVYYIAKHNGLLYCSSSSSIIIYDYDGNVVDTHNVDTPGVIDIIKIYS